MTKLQVAIICLLVVALVSFCAEAHFFGTFDNEFKDLDCSAVDVRSCGIRLTQRQARLCPKPPRFYKAVCNQTVIADKCCTGTGCSDCYLIDCCTQ
uniref:Uncharacterized protein n=1 Tax=Panagrolaimus superbus TaxID=310955 RepID=A0A914Y6K5_9BILA